MARLGYWLAFEQPIKFQSFLFAFIIFGIIAALWLCSIHMTINTKDNLKKSQELIAVFLPFKEIYESNKMKLGKPIASAVSTRESYEAAFEHGIVIWTRELAGFYQLKFSDSRWYAYNEPSWVLTTANKSDPDYKWRDECWLIKEFHPKSGFKPPNAGVAKAWYNDPEHWQWLGGMEWDFLLNGVYFQKFENGIIIDGFPRAPRNSGDNPVVFILTNDHSWYELESKNQKLPECLPPPIYNSPCRKQQDIKDGDSDKY
jgi:hypothetical protein